MKDWHQCCVLQSSICNKCRNIFVCPFNSTQGSEIYRKECALYEELPNPLDEIVNENTTNTYIESQKPKSRIEERDEIICPHCGYKFSDEIRLMGHGKELPLNFCPVCGKEVDDSKR